MYLPKALEAEFQFESKSFSNFLIDDMTQEIEVHSESTMQIIDTFIFKTTGKTIAQYRAEAAAIDARIRKENEAGVLRRFCMPTLGKVYYLSKAKSA